MGEEAFISVTFLSNIERGNIFPQTGTLCNLAKALKVEVWELFRGEGAGGYIFTKFPVPQIKKGAF